MLRTLLFFAAFWLTLILSLPVSIVAFALRAAGFGASIRKPLSLLGRSWARFILFLMGARVEVSGAERVPSEGGVCFVGNHQGDLDILVALAAIERPFGFTAKKEAMFLPVVGLWVVLLGGVFIDRKSAKKAFIAIRAGAERIRKGGAMIIFPEGKRSRGPEMREFRPGAFKLATLGDAPIVPVTIDGSYRVWEEENRIKGALVRVVFHDPIPTAGLSAEERKALSPRVEAVIRSGLADGSSAAQRS